jgi:hypothetical protein
MTRFVLLFTFRSCSALKCRHHFRFQQCVLLYMVFTVYCLLVISYDICASLHLFLSVPMCLQGCLEGSRRYVKR